MNEPKNILKTGTTTLSILCSDGIVIAADKRATMGSMIADRTADKVVPIVDDIVITIAGVFSELQRLTKLVRAELKLIEVRTNRKPTVKEAAHLFSQMNYQGIRQMGDWAIAGFLVAGKDITGYSLYEIEPAGSIKKHTDFASDGSGSLFALPILESGYKKGITVQEGIKLAVQALNQAQLRDSASGSGFDVFTVTSEGTKKVISKDITPRIEL